MQFGSYKGITLLLMVLQDSDLNSVVSDILASKTDESVRVASNLVDEGYNLLETGSLWEYSSEISVGYRDERMIADLSDDEFRKYLGVILVKAMRDDYQNYHKFADVTRVLNLVRDFAGKEQLMVGRGQSRVKDFILSNIEPVSADNSSVCAEYGVSYTLPNITAGYDGKTTVELSGPTKVVLECIRDKFSQIERMVISLQAATEATRSVNVHSFIDFDRMVLNAFKQVINSTPDTFNNTIAHLRELSKSKSCISIECPTVSTKELLVTKMPPECFDSVCAELYSLGCYGLCDKSSDYYKEQFENSALAVSISDYASEQSIALLDSIMSVGEVI